jgi:threonine-phosphate decarboxylase
MKNIHGGTIYAIARRMGIKPAELLDFSASINPLGFSPLVRTALKEYAGSILHYPDQEARDFVQELSRFHQIPAANILAGNGSTELIFMIPRVLKSKKVLVVVPTFSEYETSIRQAGGTVCYYRTTEPEQFFIQPRKLLQELRKGYDALYICNPNNPTGVLTPRSVLEDIVQAARKQATAVIIDETFIDFNENQSLKLKVKVLDNLYILRSMTKFFALPGLRAGYLISSAENIKKMKDQQEPWTMNALAQYAGTESLRDRAYIRRSVEYIKTARRELAAGLKKIACLTVFESGANYLLVKLHGAAPVNVAGLYEQLLKRWIIIRQCNTFQRMGDSFFRVAVKKKSENKILVSGLKKILEDKR